MGKELASTGNLVKPLKLSSFSSAPRPLARPSGAQAPPPSLASARRSRRPQEQQKPPEKQEEEEEEWQW